jgi:hypothetical protein
MSYLKVIHLSDYIFFRSKFSEGSKSDNIY